MLSDLAFCSSVILFRFEFGFLFVPRSFILQIKLNQINNEEGNKKIQRRDIIIPMLRKQYLPNFNLLHMLVLYYWRQTYTYILLPATAFPSVCSIFSMIFKSSLGIKWCITLFTFKRTICWYLTHRQSIHIYELNRFLLCSELTWSPEKTIK